MPDEPQAVGERYARRRANIDPQRYSFLRAENWQMAQERQRAMMALFARAGIADPSALRLVEVGAGGGANLLELLRVGFVPEKLIALELLPERVEQARRVLPAGLEVVAGDATKAPLEPASVDIVYQSVVFSSLLDDAFQHELATAMWRWLKPGGAVLWYDFTYDNPANPDVRGVPLRRVRELFPGGRIQSRRVTLAPPIARRVVRIHPSLYAFFNSLPFLRTHLLCWIEKP
jgi:SAM-dependent methyltransferase